MLLFYLLVVCIHNISTVLQHQKQCSTCWWGCIHNIQNCIATSGAVVLISQLSRSSTYVLLCVACLLYRYVDTYMQLVDTVSAANPKGLKQDKMCGRNTYQAAGDRTAKAQGKLLSGRMLMSCSHLCVVKMMNMQARYGVERYAYPNMMAACRFRDHDSGISVTMVAESAVFRGVQSAPAGGTMHVADHAVWL